LKTTSQIVGGSRTAQKQFPWQIYLNVDRSWLCGGSVISANWVLTAAHCVIGFLFCFWDTLGTDYIVVQIYRGTSFVVTVGGVDRTTTETGEKTLTSKVAIRHEKYNDDTLINDVAVIKLPSKITLGNFVFLCTDIGCLNFFKFNS
jgi:secreted trypsin-like serine protease